MHKHFRPHTKLYSCLAFIVIYVMALRLCISIRFMFMFMFILPMITNRIVYFSVQNGSWPFFSLGWPGWCFVGAKQHFCTEYISILLCYSCYFCSDNASFVSLLCFKLAQCRTYLCISHHMCCYIRTNDTIFTFHYMCARGYNGLGGLNWMKPLFGRAIKLMAIFCVFKTYERFWI